MVKIWYMDDFDQSDPRYPHMAFPPKYVTPDRLKKRTGVFLWKIVLDDATLDNPEALKVQLEWIMKDHKYVMNDLLEVKEGVTPNISSKLSEWYRSHCHRQEESRLVLDGQAYYDVEDARTGKWMRILMEKGDFIVIPAGCMHRFTTDTTNHVTMRCYYQTSEGEPHPISQANSIIEPSRVSYLRRYGGKEVTEIHSEIDRVANLQ